MNKVIKTLEMISHLKKFDYYDSFTISPDHSKVVYVIRQKPDDTSFQDITLTDQVPYSSLGSELWLTDLTTEKTELVANKNSWRPVWSPDSKLIAFYSDQNGFPQLWIYSVEDKKIKMICEKRIKSSFSHQDATCPAVESEKLFRTKYIFSLKGMQFF